MNGRQLATAVVTEIERVILGKTAVIELVMVALLARGHVLIEDVPGVGKTSLVRALATALGLSFKRIQFTPDLMPSDVTGLSLPDLAVKGEFRFNPGPIMAQIVLADEINRTSPKTQSCLLEALAEGQVTVDGVTYPLPAPHFLLATQNPIEYEGTFPLPEAQLDRFLLRLCLGYPDQAEEAAMLARHSVAQPLNAVNQVGGGAEVLAAQAEVDALYVHGDIMDYVVRLVQKTRRHPDVYLGASPRASLCLLRAAKAHAYLKGRAYAGPEDVRALAGPVLSHRLLLKPEAGLKGGSPGSIVEGILSDTPAPVGTRP